MFCKIVLSFVRNRGIVLVYWTSIVLHITNTSICTKLFHYYVSISINSINTNADSIHILEEYNQQKEADNLTTPSSSSAPSPWNLIVALSNARKSRETFHAQISSMRFFRSSLVLEVTCTVVTMFLTINTYALALVTVQPTVRTLKIPYPVWVYRTFAILTFLFKVNL